MYVPDVELHESKSLAEASTLMRRFGPDARLLAGGTDLLVDLKAGRVKTSHLISLSRIDELRSISRTDDGLRIGALTSITDLNRSPLLDGPFSPLLDASLRMAAPPIRNVATVGGNIISAVPCADLPPILMVMNAAVRLWSEGKERSVPLHDLFAGPRRTVLREGEILVAVVVPCPPPGFGAAYERFGLREGNAIAVAAVAASLTIGDGDIIEDTRITLGAVAPIPKPATSARQTLPGRVADEGAFAEAARAAREEARPISDVRGSAAFRRELIEILAGRALATAFRRAKGEAA